MNKSIAFTSMAAVGWFGLLIPISWLLRGQGGGWPSAVLGILTLGVIGSMALTFIRYAQAQTHRAAGLIATPLGSIKTASNLNLAQAEQSLHSELNEITDLEQVAPCGYHVLDREGVFVQINDTELQWLGYQSDELLHRKKFGQLLMPDSQVTFQQQWEQLQQQGGLKALELEMIRADGTILPVLLSATAIKNAVGQLVMSKAIVFNNSDRRQLEATLRKQAQQERLLTEIAQRVRQSLDSHAILNTTVAEVQNFLQTDRVLLYQFQPDWSGTIAVESVALGIRPLLGEAVEDHCFEHGWAIQYQQGQVTAHDDIQVGELHPCYVELLTRLQVRANLVVPILQGEKLWGLLIAHQCFASRQWQAWETTLLQQLATQVGIAIQQSQLYEATQQQTQREQALNRVVQAIRNSLDLETIFTTATVEITHLLDIVRAEIVQYVPARQSWRVVADYCKQPSADNAVGIEIPDACNPVADQVKQRQITTIQDSVAHADETGCPLAQIAIGTWLIVPLHFGETVWGTLSLLKQQQFSTWQDREVSLASEVAAQLAIAIQQSQLYEQVQQLNQRLEKLVHQRTSQLQELLNYEALLKRITDKVRDSLDEHQILQTAVQELTLLSVVDACHAYLRDDASSSPMHYHYTDQACPFQASVLRMRELPAIQSQLRQGYPFQLSPIAPHPVEGLISLLACPIQYEQRVLGELWLVKPTEFAFEQPEIRLVQQVANQCAIALRQSRLYQAAQAQVKELERLNRLKDDFLSTVSHELRTPMSSIKMFSQMLEILLLKEEVIQGMNSQPDQGYSLCLMPSEYQKVTHYFQILQDECDREMNLINDLLDLSRLDAGTEPLTLVTIAPQAWLIHVAEPFIERAKLQQQELQLHIPETLPLLTTDLTSLGRIVTELLNNACKYTSSGEKIIFSVQAAPADELNAAILQIHIRNSGIEIPAHELPYVFDKFYRVPNNDPWKHGGTGLGLALVKKLVQHLGGSIQAISADNETCFTVQLPIV